MKNRCLKCISALGDNQKAYELEYDHLVIGVGSLSNTFNIPGVKEYAVFLKEISNARDIRNRILSNFELAMQPGITTEEKQRLLHIVIVGGGPTGVEFGAEFYDFLTQDVTRLYPNESNEARVTLIESNQILASFDKNLRSFAEKKIKQRKNFNIVQSTVVEVKKDGVILKDGGRLNCDLVVWSTGLAPRQFTSDLNCEKNRVGQIVTDNCLRVNSLPKDSRIYAIGDCADIKDYPLPCTAQVAEKQGRHLANGLNSGVLKPFKFDSMGMLAYIGDYQGLSDMPDVKMHGIPSWFLWRSAYLTKLGSWRLRMQVPMDWSKTIMFGRDISLF
ncbi:DgyrCDS9335 [Dimorphilus gyrociliatus]|uniref:DgyrCDS9335 n=1 Tax=Dimorphilus gyrociliatus TaxID=2664684 RepID=A0A7I8VY05_9ANNE|nr:DgyrCDS9335 [Dimorphilus gyrociliatus]